MVDRKAGIVHVSGEVFRQMWGLPEGSLIHFVREHVDHNIFEFVIEGPSMPEVPEGSTPPQVDITVKKEPS